MAIILGNSNANDNLKGDSNLTIPENDEISGYSGNDTINGGLGLDTIDGGVDNDLLIIDYTSLNGSGDTGIESSFTDSDQNGESSGYIYGLDETNAPSQVDFININRFQVTGTAKNDYVSTGVGNDTLVAGAGDDYLDAGAGINNINAGSGDDVLAGGAGIHVIDGGAGTDTLVDANFAAATTDLSFDDLGTTHAPITLDDGTSVSNVENFPNVTTGSGDDAIAYSQRQDNIISTGSGDDVINSGLGFDTIDGGAGNDLLTVNYSSLNSADETGIVSDTASNANGESSGFIYGYDVNGDGYIDFSNINRLQVTGTAVKDNIVTGDGDDTLTAGSGNDTLDAGAGINNIDGGAGIDTLVDANFDAATTDLSFDDLETTADTITLEDGTSISNVENFPNILTGSGDDAIAFSQRQDNTISTGSGDDVINSGLGLDYIDGGTSGEEGVADNDLLIVDYSSFSGVGETGIQSGWPNYSDENGETNGYLYGWDDTNGFNQVFFNNINRFQVIGTEVNDVVVTGAGDDTLTAGAGDDTLTAGAGINNVDGGAGIDTLFDANFAAATTDLSFDDLETTADNINLEDGTSISNVENFPNILTGSGDDAIAFSQRQDNTISTGSGDDTINGGLGFDYIDGGTSDEDGVTDNDLLIVDYSSLSGSGETGIQSGWWNDSDENGETSGYLYGYDQISGYNQVDFSNINRFQVTGTAVNDYVVTGNNGNDSLITNAGDDSLITNAGDDTLDAGAGNDVLDGGEGNDTLDGGEGNDFYIVNDPGDTVNETSDIATEIDVIQSEVTYVLNANVENLILTSAEEINGTGNILNNTIMGNTAANTLDGGEGNDTLDGGEGNDLYVVDAAGDIITETSTVADEIDTVQSGFAFTLGANLENLTLTGAEEIDGIGNATSNNIIGNVAANTLFGNSGRDVLAGGDGNDTINGGLSDDTLDGGVGNDSLFGAGGEDNYIVDSLGDVVKETSTTATEIDTVQSGVDFTLGKYLENLTLTGEDQIKGTGNSLNNAIMGNVAANTLDGGAGNDAMTGGLGNDLYVVDAAGDTATETSELATEIDTVQSGVTFTLGANVENLTLIAAKWLNSNGNGNILDNTIAGNIGNNKLDGADGNDKLIGNSGNDVLTGGVGDDAMSGGYGGDILTGGVGNDAMSGGYGGDILTGGAGEDNMNGGAGSDKFLYDTNAIFASSAVGTDRIADFVIGTDKIVLDQTTFTDLTSTIGNGFSVTSEFAVVGSDAAASTTEALIVYSSATDHLFYNQNGSAAGLGSGTNFATLSGIDNMSADDFVLQA